MLVRHEQGAAHMADGYARASGKVGVAIATSGPGATNLVTGIATAMLDSIPIVCITGNVSSKVLGTDAFQEVDITGITLPVTKHNFLVNTRRGHGAARCATHFRLRAPAVPARCWSTLQRMRSRRRRDLRFRSRQAAPVSSASHAARGGLGTGAGRRADSQRQAAGDSGRPRRDGIGRDGAGAHAWPSARRFPWRLRCWGSAVFPPRIR